MNEARFSDIPLIFIEKKSVFGIISFFLVVEAEKVEE